MVIASRTSPYSSRRSVLWILQANGGVTVILVTYKLGVKNHCNYIVCIFCMFVPSSCNGERSSISIIEMLSCNCVFE
jgi:hypothetical protein